MNTFSRIKPFALRFTRRPLNTPLLTTIPLQEKVLNMKRSVSGQENPRDPSSSPQLQSTRNIIDEQREEQDPVRKEKAISEGLLQQYFSRAAGFRIVVDEQQPEILHRNDDGTQVRVPDSQIVLTRIEKEDTVDAGGKGKIHAVHLYVHADPSETLVSRFTDIVRGKDEAAELATPNAAFAILQAGTSIMFFKYNRAHSSGKGGLKSLGAGLRGP